jgi:hypothetical protein
MGDKKSKKDRAKEQRQTKAREVKVATQKRDRQPQKMPGVT